MYVSSFENDVYLCVYIDLKLYDVYFLIKICILCVFLFDVCMCVYFEIVYLCMWLVDVCMYVCFEIV
jgi:hypothetical protein